MTSYEQDLESINLEDVSCDLKELDDESLHGDSWTNTAQLQLVRWKHDAERLSSLHNLSRSKFAFLSHCVNIPLIFFSGITTIALGFQRSGGEGMSDVARNTTLILSGLTTFLSGLNSYYNFSTRAGNHNNASNAYGGLVRNIDYTISLHPSKRPDVEVSFVQTCSSFDSIGGTSPPIPGGVEKQLAKK